MAFFHFGQAPLHPGLGLFVTAALVRTVSEGRDLVGTFQAARFRRRDSGDVIQAARSVKPLTSGSNRWRSSSVMIDSMTCLNPDRLSGWAFSKA